MLEKMRLSRLSVICRICVWLSLVLSFAGFIAIIFPGFSIYPLGYIPPYRNLGVILFLFGILLFVLAYVGNRKYAEEVKANYHLG